MGCWCMSNKKRKAGRSDNRVGSSRASRLGGTKSGDGRKSGGRDVSNIWRDGPTFGLLVSTSFHRTRVTSDLVAVTELSDHGLGKGGASSLRGSPLTPVFSRF